MPIDLAHVNFSIVLFALTVATGVAWLADFAVFRPGRVAGARAASPRFDGEVADGLRHAPGRRLRTPRWIDLPAGFFPALLAVFLLRSFVFEPFRIPSESMVPTLRVGDLILVEKFAYGVRLPFVERTVFATGKPARGDVVVFRYPLDPSENYVKRVVGLPGDTVVYRDKRLTINGRPVAIAAAGDFVDAESGRGAPRFTETLPNGDAGRQHAILVDERRTDAFGPIAPFPALERCTYAPDHTAVACTVPDGEYFVMGDNRDNSADSRYWGFVPDRNLVGKAVLIWMNFGDLGRIGRFD